MDYFTINSVNATNLGGTNVWQYMSTAMAVLYNPATGSRTISFTEDDGGTLTDNNIELVYLKGVDTSDVGWTVTIGSGSSGSDHSPANITVGTGEIALCASGSWNGSYNSTFRGSRMVVWLGM